MFLLLFKSGFRKHQQDHTSQDHFCSVIDEFPVWYSEPDQPAMMSWAAVLEREKASELLSALMIVHPPLKEDGWDCCYLSAVAL